MKRMRVVSRALSMASTVSGRDWADAEMVIVVASVIRVRAVLRTRLQRIPGLKRFRSRRRFFPGLKSSRGLPPWERVRKPGMRGLREKNTDIRRPPRMAIGGAGGRG